MRPYPDQARHLHEVLPRILRNLRMRRYLSRAGVADRAGLHHADLLALETHAGDLAPLIRLVAALDAELVVGVATENGIEWASAPFDSPDFMESRLRAMGARPDLRADGAEVEEEARVYAGLGDRVGAGSVPAVSSCSTCGNLLPADRHPLPGQQHAGGCECESCYLDSIDRDVEP